MIRKTARRAQGVTKTLRREKSLLTLGSPRVCCGRLEPWYCIAATIPQRVGPVRAWGTGAGGDAKDFGRGGRYYREIMHVRFVVDIYLCGIFLYEQKKERGFRLSGRRVTSFVYLVVGQLT